MPRQLPQTLEQYVNAGPEGAVKVRLRVPKDSSRGQEANSKLWPCVDGAIDAATADEMILWHADNCDGVRYVRLEWLDGSGNAMPGSVSVNGAGVFDAEAEPVPEPTPVMAPAKLDNDLTTKEIVGLLVQQVKDRDSYQRAAGDQLLSVARELSNALSAQSRAVVQIGSDNAARAEGMITTLIGELLTAKDDARESAVKRAQEAKPGESEGDLVKLAREAKDMLKESSSNGLSKFLESLVKGDKPSIDTLRKQLSRFSEEDKLRIVAALTSND